jgi:sortase A
MKKSKWVHACSPLCQPLLKLVWVEIGYNQWLDTPGRKRKPVPRQRSLEDLSTEELRQLLVEKNRKNREARIDAYRRSGRVIPVETAAQAYEQPSPLDADEDDLLISATTRRRGNNRQRANLDKFLLTVEILAIVGVAVIFVYGLNLLNNLNHQYTASNTLPTLTPTALITAVVLPGGHTPPVNGAEVTFNEAEIPEHLRPLMQSLANIPVPTSSPQQAIRMQIPAINVDQSVVQGDGWEQLKKGIGQHIGTADPGNPGNLVVSAHNDIFGEIFRDLDHLKSGDQIVVYTAARAYTYVVTSSEIVDPTRVDVMDATTTPTLTLISCYPYRVDNKRIVILASLQNN